MESTDDLRAFRIHLDVYLPSPLPCSPRSFFKAAMPSVFFGLISIDRV